MDKFFIIITVLTIILCLILFIPDSFFKKNESINDNNNQDSFSDLFENSYSSNGLILYPLIKYFPIEDENYFISELTETFDKSNFIIDENDYKLNDFSNKNDFDEFLSTGLNENNRKFKFFNLNIINNEEDCIIEYNNNLSSIGSIINLKNNIIINKIYFLNKDYLLKIPFYTSYDILNFLEIKRLAIGYKSMNKFNLLYYFFKSRESTYENIYYYNKTNDLYTSDLSSVSDLDNYNYLISFINMPPVINNSYEIINFDFDEKIYDCNVFLLPDNIEITKNNYQSIIISKNNIIKLYCRNKNINNLKQSLIFFYSYNINFEISVVKNDK